jgi:hypothetical protein
MARDPAIQHDDNELRAGLARAEDAGALDDEPLRAELVHLGLLRFDEAANQLVLTPEGRRFLR